MNFRTHNDGPVNDSGTSLQGYVQATLLELTRVFGKPQGTSDHVTTEWLIRFEDGTIATIYDWDRAEPPAPTEVIDWHIGGMTRRATILVHGVFRSNYQRKAA